ncbi:MAG: hypothetical protein K0R38_2389 [Polyangiaceae bacterium]|nr:hypothetical protein [Polyangiaceae bacterium]
MGKRHRKAHAKVRFRTKAGICEDSARLSRHTPGVKLSATWERLPTRQTRGPAQLPPQARFIALAGAHPAARRPSADWTILRRVRALWATLPAVSEAVIARTVAWLESAVIGLNLCPFAKAVHLRGQIRYVVSEATGDALLEELELDGTLQIASFHPDYCFADAATDDPANYSNRSPYPMLHLLREESVTRAVDAFPDTSKIYERNIETLRGLSAERLRALVESD